MEHLREDSFTKEDYQILAAFESRTRRVSAQSHYFQSKAIGMSEYDILEDWSHIAEHEGNVDYSVGNVWVADGIIGRDTVETGNGFLAERKNWRGDGTYTVAVNAIHFGDVYRKEVCPDDCLGTYQYGWLQIVGGIITAYSDHYRTAGFWVRIPWGDQVWQPLAEGLNLASLFESGYDFGERIASAFYHETGLQY